MRRLLASHRNSHGFSLVEILVSIGVMAVLSAMLIPALSRVRKTSDATRCASNLRQIGMAIHMYVSDHDMLLPGPLRITQKVTYNNTDSGHLGYHLYDYLGLPKPRGTRQWIMVMYCPAWKRLAPDPDSVDATPYRLVTTGSLPGNKSGTPFGYIATSTTTYRLTAMTWDSLQNIPAIEDADISTILAHETFRNTLFFDWHVDRVAK